MEIILLFDEILGDLADLFWRGWELRFDGGSAIIPFIIWLAPRAGKMSQILRCDWLPERARWSYLARSGLPVARPLGIESLIPTTMRVFFDFLVDLGENAH